MASSTSEDRLPIIKSCLEGLHRGEAEPLFIGDIDWAVAEIERLREERDAAQRSAREMHIAADQFARERDELRAGNERLRETIAEWQEIHGTLTGDVHAACQSEIERLRTELRGFICEECLKPLGSPKDDG